MSANRIQRLLNTTTRLTLAVVVVVLLFACSSTKPVSMQIDDAAIKTEVLAKLSTNGETNPFRLDVQVSEGLVHLAGTVDNEHERELAAREARSVDGVRRVVNDIRIGNPTGGQMADDGTITA